MLLIAAAKLLHQPPKEFKDDDEEEEEEDVSEGSVEAKLQIEKPMKSEASDNFLDIARLLKKSASAAPSAKSAYSEAYLEANNKLVIPKPSHSHNPKSKNSFIEAQHLNISGHDAPSQRLLLISRSRGSQKSSNSVREDSYRTLHNGYDYF